MNDDIRAYRCLKFKGKPLEYFDENGDRRTRILEDVIRGCGNNNVALFRYESRVGRFLFNHKRVPLAKVILPPEPVSDDSPVQAKNEYTTGPNTNGYTNTRSSAVTQQPAKQFHYYGEWYKINYWDNLKTGDTVVWTKFSTKENPCMGKVVVTAEKENVMGSSDLVVVVRLGKLLYATNGINPPRNFNQYDNTPNTYLIPDSELLKIEEWVEVRNQPDDQDEQGDWQTVTRRNGGRSKQPRPNTDYYYDYTQKDINGLLDTASNFRKPDVKPNQELIEKRFQRPKSMDATSSVDRRQSDNEIIRSKDDWKVSIDWTNFANTVTEHHGIGVGIQGYNNSCYIDTSIFSLFAFSNNFHQYLDTIGNIETSQNVKQILRENIISNLRCYPFFVSYKNIRKLRTILRKEINQEYRSQHMDVEELLTDLFKLLEIPPLLIYNNGESDYIHQIALPFTWEQDQRTSYLSLQSLLENSFKTFEVNLTQLSGNIFVVKLPVTDGVLIPCDGVIPNLHLSLKRLMNDKNPQELILTLQAVICLRDNHFVTFVRTNKALNSPWVYMDSNPTMPEPYVQILPDIDHNVDLALKALERETEPSKIRLCEPVCQKFSLFQHAYICIYEI